VLLQSFCSGINPFLLDHHRALPTALGGRRKDDGTRLPGYEGCCRGYCSPALLTRNDTFLEDLTRNADRPFYFDEGPKATTKLIAKAYLWTQKSQTTLEVFSRSNGRGNEK